MSNNSRWKRRAAAYGESGWPSDANPSVWTNFGGFAGARGVQTTRRWTFNASGRGPGSDTARCEGSAAADTGDQSSIPEEDCSSGQAEAADPHEDVGTNGDGDASLWQASPPSISRLDCTPGGPYAVSASSGDGWVQRAAHILENEGFVVVLDVLDPPAVEEVLQACIDTEAEVLLHDPKFLGNRDPGRYSFGAAARSGHMLHHPAWRHLLDCDAVLSVLHEALPGGFQFSGGGGDFVRGGTANYQALHSDLGPRRVPVQQQTNWPPPKMAVNFAVQDIMSEDFGPMRLVPRRKVLSEEFEHPPAFAQEPEEMRFSKVFPMPAGAALIRDLRLWHAGTPNTTDTTRFLPNVELWGADYVKFLEEPHTRNRLHCAVCGFRCPIPAKDRSKVLCPDVYAQLSTRCQERCSNLVAESSSQIPRGVREYHAKLQQSWTKGAKGSKGKSAGAGGGKGWRAMPYPDSGSWGSPASSSWY